jgi:hypothetical protein
MIERDELRRDTRVRVLESLGHNVVLRSDYIDSKALNHEGTFDLLIISLNRSEVDAASAYSDTVIAAMPTLPILLITDFGVFVPRGTLARVMQAGGPKELVSEVSNLLAASMHIRELNANATHPERATTRKLVAERHPKHKLRRDRGPVPRFFRDRDPSHLGPDLQRDLIHV